jgi:hypothetical protein
VNLDPALAGGIGAFLSAAATALLMFAAYQWPAGRNHADDEHHHHHHRHDDDEDG